MPCSRAVAHSERTSSIVPSSGCTASWPPSARRSRTASRDRPGRPRACCCGPCGSCGRSGGSAAGRARRSRARRSAGRAPRRPSARPTSAGTARTRTRSARARGRPRSPAGRRCAASWRSPWRSTAASTSGASAASNLALSAACSSRRMSSARSSIVRSAPRSARAGGVLEQQRALGELAAEVVLAGVDLALQLVAPGREDVAPGLDRSTPSARACRPELALPADAVVMGVERVHRRLESSRRPR